MIRDADLRLTGAFSILILLGGLVAIALLVSESHRLHRAVTIEDESLQQLVEQHADLKARRAKWRGSRPAPE